MYILSHLLGSEVDLSRIRIVMAPTTTNLGAWRSIGSRAMVRVEAQQPFTLYKALDQMDAQHGAVDQHTITTERVPFTCVWNIQMMVSGTSFEMVSQLWVMIQLLEGMIGTKSKMLTSSKGQSFIRPSGRGLGFHVMIVGAAPAIWMDHLFQSAIWWFQEQLFKGQSQRTAVDPFQLQPQVRPHHQLNVPLCSTISIVVAITIPWYPRVHPRIVAVNVQPICHVEVSHTQRMTARVKQTRCAT